MPRHPERSRRILKNKEKQLKSLEIIVIIYLVWNAIVFIITGIDKLKAKQHWYRISEFALLISAFLMGSLGLTLGMLAFHHKVSKPKFRILAPLFMLANILTMYLIYKYI